MIKTDIDFDLSSFYCKIRLFHFHDGLAHYVLEPLLAKVSLRKVCFESLEGLLNMILFRRVGRKSKHGELLPLQVGLAAVAHVHGGIIEHDDSRAYVFFAKPVAELRVQKLEEEYHMLRLRGTGLQHERVFVRQYHSRHHVYPRARPDDGVWSVLVSPGVQSDVLWTHGRLVHVDHVKSDGFELLYYICK